MRQLQQLVDAGDTAALLLAVDGLCASREWDRLADLARRCRDAIELGKQLWSVAMHIDYRLAWEGPAPHAASVLRPGAGRFALGPLTEVAASTHEWDALRPHLADPAAASAVAQERVIRGEDLRHSADLEFAELPLCAQSWEPAYALPEYRDRSARFPVPAVAAQPLPPVGALESGAEERGEDLSSRALREVVETWVSQSSGRVRVAAVEGGAGRAVGAIHSVAAMGEIRPGEALAMLQWAGASGGAYGRRRGGAAGRFAAWWAAAALAGIEWPDDTAAIGALAADLGEAVGELRWFRWRPPEPEAGWTLHLAVEDPVDGLAWAVEAVDRRDDETPGEYASMTL